MAPRGALAWEWQVWAAENLARGIDRSRVEATLRERRVPKKHIARLFASLDRSPVFVAAKRLAISTRRHELLASLHNTLLRTRKTPLRIERRSGVSANELYERYYATNTPVVLTDVITRWPAFRKWTPEYLATRFGEVRIRATMNRDADPDYDMHTPAHSKLVRIERFVEMIRNDPRSNDFYAVAQNKNIDRPELRALWRDVKLDPALLDRKRLRGSAALWLGPAGTITPLHHDTSNILFGQIYGRKRFLLASPHETSLWEGVRGFYAKSPPASYPDVLFSKVDLKPGELLFLPVAWWHHVQSLDVSISLAFTCLKRPNFFDWYRPGHFG